MAKHEQKNLFDKPFEFTTGSRHVEYNVETVTVGGATFDLHDLYSTLENVDGGGSLIVNVEMCNVLKELNVLKYCGSRRNCLPASKGRRFQEFMDMVEELGFGADDG